MDVYGISPWDKFAILQISGGQIHPANQLCPFYEGPVVRQ